MNEVEFKRLQTETDVVNSDDRRMERWRESIARIMAVTGMDRGKVINLMLNRIERDRKKKISTDKSVAQLVADTESEGF